MRLASKMAKSDSKKIIFVSPNSKPMTHSIQRTLANVCKRLEIHPVDVDKNNYKNLYGAKSWERNKELPDVLTVKVLFEISKDGFSA